MNFAPYFHFSRQSFGLGLELNYDWSYDIREFRFYLRVLFISVGFVLDKDMRVAK